jgi:hypothetical protein
VLLGGVFALVDDVVAVGGEADSVGGAIEDGLEQFVEDVIQSAWDYERLNGIRNGC